MSLQSEWTMKSATPVFRIFDEAKAKQFYCGFLAFNVDWAHRYEAELPLYMQVSSGNLTLHLTEHHGDCTPGSTVRIEVAHIEDLHNQLIGKRYKYARPGLERVDGRKEIRLTDPFGNHIIFYERE